MSPLDHSQECLIVCFYFSNKTDAVGIQKNHLIEIDENFFFNVVLKCFSGPMSQVWSPNCVLECNLIIYMYDIMHANLI